MHIYCTLVFVVIVAEINAVVSLAIYVAEILHTVH